MFFTIIVVSVKISNTSHSQKKRRKAVSDEEYEKGDIVAIHYGIYEESDHTLSDIVVCLKDFKMKILFKCPVNRVHCHANQLFLTTQ